MDHWSENLYYQYFCVEPSFQPSIPCVPTELMTFRRRIGTEGMELIPAESIHVNDLLDDAGNTIISVDTIIQNKNIT